MTLTRFRFAIAKVLVLLAALVITWAINGCTTFEKAHRKFATDKIDTTFQTVTLTIPRDSVVKVIKTDTTHLIERVRQGRATVTIIREPTNTTVIANCDSAQTKTVVIVKTVKQLWGVAPWYENGFWIAIGILIIATILYVFMYHLQLRISKR